MQGLGVGLGVRGVGLRLVRVIAQSAQYPLTKEYTLSYRGLNIAVYAIFLVSVVFNQVI